MVIYKKSETGLAEIAATKRSLNFRQRQVLILIDGQRTVEELENLLKTSNVTVILEELKTLGYLEQITSITQNAPTVIAQAIIVEPTINLDITQIDHIKIIVITSSDEHLGIMGRGIKQDITNAQNHLEIKACVSQWHMAMRESKTGRALAGELMELVQDVISQSPITT